MMTTERTKRRRRRRRCRQLFSSFSFSVTTSKNRTEVKKKGTREK